MQEKRSRFPAEKRAISRKLRQIQVYHIHSLPSAPGQQSTCQQWQYKLYSEPVLGKQSRRWFSSRAAQWVLAFLCLLCTLRSFILGSSTLKSLSIAIGQEGDREKMFDPFRRAMVAKQMLPVPLQGVYSTRIPKLKKKMVAKMQPDGEFELHKPVEKTVPGAEVSRRRSEEEKQARKIHSRLQKEQGATTSDKGQPTLGRGKAHIAVAPEKRKVVKGNTSRMKAKSRTRNIKHPRTRNIKHRRLEYNDPDEPHGVLQTKFTRENKLLPSNLVHTKITTDEPLLETISTGKDKRMPSRGFIWHGRHLCYDPHISKFTASRYRRPEGYIPRKYSARFPDRIFARRDVKMSDVKIWHKGLTIVPVNYPLNETKAHFLMRLGNAFHLYRYAHEVLRVPFANLSILFDELSIPPDLNHLVQRELFSSSFADLPEQNLRSRNKITDLACFENVILHDWRSTPSLRMSMWPPDLVYFRKLMSRWESKQENPFEMRHDCTERTGEPQKTVWIVQRRTKHRSRVITNIDDLKDRVRQVFGAGWKVVEFDSANTPCSLLNGSKCLGYPVCDISSSGKAGFQCPSEPSLSREVRLFNKINVMIGIHGATFMNTVFMAAGATVVEIFPAGIEEYVYAAFSRRAGLSYIGWREPNTTELIKRFPHQGTRGCFKHTACRRAIRELPVTISLKKFDAILRVARDTHARRCLGKHIASQTNEHVKTGAPGEPKWMMYS